MTLFALPVTRIMIRILLLMFPGSAVNEGKGQHPRIFGKFQRPSPSSEDSYGGNVQEEKFSG